MNQFLAETVAVMERLYKVMTKKKKKQRSLYISFDALEYTIRMTTTPPHHNNIVSIISSFVFLLRNQ